MTTYNNEWERRADKYNEIQNSKFSTIDNSYTTMLEKIHKKYQILFIIFICGCFLLSTLTLYLLANNYLKNNVNQQVSLSPMFNASINVSSVNDYFNQISPVINVYLNQTVIIQKIVLNSTI